MKTLVIVLAGFAMPLQAQSLASRVAAVGDGAVSFHFAARPGVCGDGKHYVRTSQSTYHGTFWTNREREPCVAGPVQVRLTMKGGSVRSLESWVGPLRSRGGKDLGAVSAPEAARYLISVAERSAPEASKHAIFPAVLADSATVWPFLFGIARDGERSRATRQDAAFWLSRYAGAAIAGRPGDPFVDDHTEASEDDELKRHAVFVLSQLPRDDGIPQLLDVARSNKSWKVRSHAFFWLAESGDPRAIDVFEEVLKP